jgi:acetyl-CoA carboxylase biotin carboxylase subunit
VAGGGGKGMRLVSQKSELVGAWRDASSEAQNAFGDGRLYLEKYLPRPRHIEIQVLGDQHGHLLYLGERECSVQRRYQKVIEEAPSPVVTPELRSEMGEAAVKLARAGGYTNAGTVEFLLDVDDHFYFLEMNTRLQVEHPVTEMVTSLDLVKLQIRIAAGEPLPFAQQDVSISGHAIECRIYAEDPENNFFPSPGTILEQRPPTGPGIRMDDGIYPGWTVPGDYDPMLGKLIAWGSDRAEAIARMRRALHEYYITGIRTNISLFRRILNDPDFQRGEVYTSWLDDFLQRPVATISSMVDPRPESASEKSGSPSQAETAAVLAAALWHSSHATSTSGSGSNHEHNPSSTWKTEGRIEQMAREPLR